MINHQKRKFASIYHNFSRLTGVVAFALASSFLATPLMAGDNSATKYSLSGELDTTFRMRTTIDKKTLLPIYEYARLDLTNNLSHGAVASFYLGAWGRADLADKSGNNFTDGDLQYAYLSYRAALNNTIINLGRQFVTEGVATERVDGFYLRSDFAAGFGSSVFAGAPVISEPDFKGGKVLYGTRISQTNKKDYTLGLSVLKSERANKSIYREEEGLDVWLHPMEQVDLSGRSTYNSLTEGWMEHAYVLSVSPLEKIRLSVDVSQINYHDYFFNMTTTALSFINRPIDPNEKLFAGGVTISYLPIKNLTISTDYKSYNYEIAKNADYFGGKASYTVPQSFAVGFGAHRMDGRIARLRYTEYRGYVSKVVGHASVALDVTNVGYDAAINGVKNSFAVNGSTGYELNEKLKIGASMEYLQSPDFDNEVRGLVNATYIFDTKRVKGGGKNEK